MSAFAADVPLRDAVIADIKIHGMAAVAECAGLFSRTALR